MISCGIIDWPWGHATFLSGGMFSAKLNIRAVQRRQCGHRALSCVLWRSDPDKDGHTSAVKQACLDSRYKAKLLFQHPYRSTLRVQNIRNTFLTLSFTPFCNQNSLNLLGHGLSKVLKAFHRDAGCVDSSASLG